MGLAGVEGNRTAKLVEEQAAIITEAMRTFFDKKLLERVGFADRGDLVRVPEIESDPEATITENLHAAQPSGQPEIASTSVETTEAELEVFDYVKRRLPFLIDRDEGLYRKLENIFMKDRKQVLNVSYKKEMKGKLFRFREGEDPKYRFEFSDSDTHIETNNLSDIDEELLGIFMRRVKELG